jgi:multidrug resistance efflux pump
MKTLHESAPNTTPTDSDDREVLRSRVRSLRIAKTAPPDRRSWPYLLAALLLAVGAAAGGYGYAAWTRASTSDAMAASKPGSPSPQPVASQSTATSDLVLESKGYIIPAKQVLVSPKVSGMLMTLNIAEGQRVAQGDVLAILEDTDYQADYARAVAALEAATQRHKESQGYRPEEIDQARAELSEAQALLEQYKDDWKRAATLSEAKALSTEVRDAAQSRLRGSEQRVRRLTLAAALMEKGPRDERKRAAEAEVREAEADLAKAKWRLDNCTIRAPISGTILRKNAEEGNIVNTIAFNGSYSLCEMADLSDLEVELYIQERDISKVRPGQKCQIRAEAFPDRVYDGVVARLMPIADRAKGAVPVRVKIDIPREEEGVYLKPEMGAVVAFLAVPPAPPDPDTTATSTTQLEAMRQ